MTREECEKKIAGLLEQVVNAAQEYEPRSEFFYMSFHIKPGMLVFFNDYLINQDPVKKPIDKIMTIKRRSKNEHA